MHILLTTTTTKNGKCNVTKYGINVGTEGKATDLAVTEIEERKLWMSTNAFQEKLMMS